MSDWDNQTYVLKSYHYNGTSSLYVYTVDLRIATSILERPLFSSIFFLLTEN